MGLLILLAGSGTGVAPGTTPEDDDADTSFTAFTDRDGATLRVPRIDCLTAPDSCAQAALGNVERLAADRYMTHALRIGRGRTFAGMHRIAAQSSRAGDVLAVKGMIVEYEAVRDANNVVRAAETTSTGADRDAATVGVPTVSFMHAADSMRNASLTQSPADAQDRWRVDLVPGSDTRTGFMRTGLTHRIAIQTDGRAGAPLAIRAIVIEYDKVGDGNNLVRTAAT